MIKARIVNYCQHRDFFAGMYAKLADSGVRGPYELNPKPRELLGGKVIHGFEPGSGIEVAADGGLYGDCPLCAGQEPRETMVGANTPKGDA